MPNRTICDVLKAMRTCHDNRNYSYLISLVEEAQNMANRMEAALWDQSDIKYLREEKSQLKAEVAKLKKLKKKYEHE